MAILVFSLIISIEALLISVLLVNADWAIYALIAVALSPLLLLCFWQKPKLKSCQTIYSVVFALAAGCFTVFLYNITFSSAQFYPQVMEKDIVNYCSLYLMIIAIILGVILARCKKHYLLFALGALFAIASVCIPQKSVAACAVVFGLLSVAAGLVIASAISLNRKIEQTAQIFEIKTNNFRVLLRNLGFVLPPINLFFLLIIRYCAPTGLAACGLSANIVCAVLLFVLCFTYLRQPLDFVTEKKLALYEKGSDDLNLELMKTQLYDRLCNVQNYPIAMMAKKILEKLVKVKTEGFENVTESTACFVANHYEIYGPFIAEVKFPLVFRPWTEAAMTEKQSIERQLTRGIDNLTGKWLIKPLRRFLRFLVAKPLWRLITTIRPIPVYHTNFEKMENMLCESAEALTVGDSLLVFPEKAPNNQNYRIGGIDKLQSGFIEIAEKYKNLTGKDMCFYPVYIDKAGKRIIVGEKVYYDSAAEKHEEKTRIADELYEKINEMYENCEKNRKIKNKKH